MAKNKSDIEWTDVTWNPSRGCREVSPGCARCYAKTFAERFRGVPGHPYEQGFDLRLVPEKLPEPLRYAPGTMAFVDSMSDLFFEEIPDEFVFSVFGMMAVCQDVIFQVLTKRTSRALELFEDRGLETAAEAVAGAAEGLRRPDGRRLVIWDPRGSEAHRYIRPPAKKDLEIRTPWPGWPLPNVWIGASVEDQPRADERIPELLRIPAAVRFISAEPLLGPLELDAPGRPWMTTEIDHQEDTRLDWVIVGGESGPRRRPMSLEWARSIRDDCLRADVPFFFKQIDKKTEIPADLMIRQFPGGRP